VLLEFFFSETFLIVRRIRTDIIKAQVLEHSNRYSCQILVELEFYGQILQKYSNTNFTKIRPVGAEFSHADRQKDKHEGKLPAIVRTRLKICLRPTG
jgi:hypothetical protein